MSDFNHKIKTFKELNNFVKIMNERECPDDTKIFFERVDIQNQKISNEPMVILICIPTDERKKMSLVFSEDSLNKCELK